MNHRPGRPRAIPLELVPKVLTLYRGGLGYRAIARQLTEDGVSVHWSTVRKLIKTERDRATIERETSNEF